VTSPVPPNARRPWRSIGAVLAGVVVIVVLSIGTDIVMHAIGALPPLGQPMGHAHAVLAIAYRIIYGIVGGYVTAWLAPGRPMQHALAFGIIGLVLSTIGAMATWNEGPAFGPKWYSVGLIVTAMPCAWAGGKLCAPGNPDQSIVKY
jgi:hypothetical protein